VVFFLIFKEILCALCDTLCALCDIFAAVRELRPPVPCYTVRGMVLYIEGIDNERVKKQ
jgi:hypothetical protein